MINPLSSVDSLSVSVEVDKINSEISSIFEYKFDGKVTTDIPNSSWVKSMIPKDFSIGLIVGPSGSGKSSLLKEFGVTEQYLWDNRSVCSHFESAENVKNYFSAVGFNSVPSWLKPYHVLSNGEKFRVDLAMALYRSITVVDEFTSVVDRNVAITCCSALRKFVDRTNKRGIIFASCHRDIIDWLLPDWVFDTQNMKLSVRGSDRQPTINITLTPCGWEQWKSFSKHHYLSSEISKGSRCWLATWEDNVVGFTSILSMPSGTLKNAWRGHRTVVLPDFQGIGIGSRISDAMGAIVTKEGGRYFSKSANPTLVSYRNSSHRWKPTSKNSVIRDDNASNKNRCNANNDHLLRNRVCGSHEYIGGWDWLELTQPDKTITKKLW